MPWRVGARTQFTVSSVTPCPAPPTGIVVTATAAEAYVLDKTLTLYVVQDPFVTPAADGSWKKTLYSASGPVSNSTTFYLASFCTWTLPDSTDPFVSQV